jgi:hypothetical protein
MHPGDGATAECNVLYSWSPVTLFLEPSNTELASVTAAQAGNVGTYSSCSTSNNPAIFVERY